MRKVGKTEHDRLVDSIDKITAFSDFVVNVKNAVHNQIVNETYLNARIAEIQEKAYRLTGE